MAEGTDATGMGRRLKSLARRNLSAAAACWILAVSSLALWALLCVGFEVVHAATGMGARAAAARIAIIEEARPFHALSTSLPVLVFCLLGSMQPRGEGKAAQWPGSAATSATRSFAAAICIVAVSAMILAAMIPLAPLPGMVREAASKPAAFAGAVSTMLACVAACMATNGLCAGLALPPKRRALASCALGYLWTTGTILVAFGAVYTPFRVHAFVSDASAVGEASFVPFAWIGVSAGLSREASVMLSPVAGLAMAWAGELIASRAPAGPRGAAKVGAAAAA